MERVLKIEKSKRRSKKYVATVTGNRRIWFGSSDHGQYFDRALGLYSRKNHKDAKRRRNYFMRHSGVPGKRAAIQKELRKSRGKLNARILAHRFLW